MNARSEQGRVAACSCHGYVLFADLAGFTAWAGARDAKEVQDHLQALWRVLDAIIDQHGGHVLRHVGDGLLTVWGWEQAREDDPAQAVRAAWTCRCG